MRSPARPFFHASATVPLTGREPVIGRLRGRLQHRGSGWGQVILTAPREAGVSRLLDECERILGQPDGRPVLRIRPRAAHAPALEPLRQALLAFFARAPRETVRDALAVALGSSAVVSEPLAWICDGPLVGATAPSGDLVRDLLRGLRPGGPLLVDDLARLDEATRSLVVAEGAAEGIGLLAGSTAGEVGPAEARWPLQPLGELQIGLMLRRWLRHPVAVRRLTPLLHGRTGGWPGAVVRAVRRLGRLGALEETKRGVAVITWPPPLECALEPGPFPTWVERQSADVRHLLEVAAIQGDPEDDHFLARAAGVRLGVVADARAEIDEIFPGSGRHLFPTDEERRQLVLQLDDRKREDLVQALHRTWSRRREEAEPRAASRAARLRVAVAHGDAAASASALEQLLACVPEGAAPHADGRHLLRAALDVVPAGAPGAARARDLLARPESAVVGLYETSGDVAARAARHEDLAEQAGARGRKRARAAHLRRAARLHEARGATPAAAEAWDALAAVERSIGRSSRAFDAHLRALTAYESRGEAARARETRHRAADVAIELQSYDRAVELLRACLDQDLLPTEAPEWRASIHLSLARAQHGRGDLEAERRHAEAASVPAATPPVRLGAEARLLALRLRAGDDEAGALLAGFEERLEAAGLSSETGVVRRALAARPRLEEAEETDAIAGAPAARLRAARRLILSGRSQAGRKMLVELAEDARVSIDLRVEALARLAHARLRTNDEAGAHEAACRADALLEIGRRSRANDASLHHLLAVAFRALGEMGRAIRHRRASRTARRRSGGEATSRPLAETRLPRRA